MDIESTIYVNRYDVSTLYDIFTHSFEITQRSDIDDVIALVKLECTRKYKAVLRNLKKSKKAELKGNFKKAIKFALKAARALTCIDTQRADEIHEAVAYIIKDLAKQYNNLGATH